MESRYLKTVVLRAFAEAKSHGRDFLGQIQAGVNVVRTINPNMKKSEAIDYVNSLLAYLA